ncbi:hypothetical protein [Nocardia carnea]|uniref:hypothetical protein n=1 Tax=Nocardia carnea TaxID=37328 RepID=UPI002456970B|nr:hypothetical protein [Nocardia carnea]
MSIDESIWERRHPSLFAPYTAATKQVVAEVLDNHHLDQHAPEPDTELITTLLRTAEHAIHTQHKGRPAPAR